MDLVKKSVCLLLFLLSLSLGSVGAEKTKIDLTQLDVVLSPDDGDFLPDTVNVFHIAKDVSEIFMDAIGGSVYHDINGDTALLNKIFIANYTSNDIGQAYRDAIDVQIRAQKGDFGLNVKGDFTENFTPGLSVDEDLTFKRRLYVGLEWDIIKGGLFDSGNKIHQLKMQAILKEYEALEFAERENYRYLFNYVNYIFNVKKIEVLDERKVLIRKQLKYTRELYHLRYVGWEKVLQYQAKLEDIDHQIFQYESFNRHIAANVPDTLITTDLSADDLPLFDVNLDSLMKIYYSHHSEDTVTQIKLAIYKDNIKWWKDISLKPFVRYNMYINEFNAYRNYGSAGVGMTVPLRFHNKQKLIRAQEVIYQSEQTKELESGDNELVNIYAEFGFKLKQIKDFYYRKMLNDELIRKELVKKEYHDVGFNPVFTLGLIDDKKAIESEIIDLKKRMYINLVRLAFYLEDRTPTDFITVLDAQDFTGRYNGSVKIFVNSNDIAEHSPIGVVNYLWKNEFIDVIIENEGSEISPELALMIDKSKLASITYSIMRNIPNNGQYPSVSDDISEITNWDDSNIIGLHYELGLTSEQDSLSEVSDVELSDWVSSIEDNSPARSLRLSIGVPPGLSISLLNRIFKKFDLVFVHESGVPNLDRVEDMYSSEISLDADRFVLSLKGTDFVDRIHLENYMANLYDNLGLDNFAFSDFSSMMDVDMKTFEKGSDINLQPGELVASISNQIYLAEEKEALLGEIERASSETDVTEIEIITDAEIKEETGTEVEEYSSPQVQIVINNEEISNSEVVDSTYVDIVENTEEDVVESSDVELAVQLVQEESTNEILEDQTIENPYRIQIAASKVMLSDEFLNKFKTDEIREIEIDGYYKYTIGNYQSESDAMYYLKVYKAKSGNTGAFVVTY